MDTNELKALAKMLTYASDTLLAMLESEEPADETPAGVDWSKPIQTRAGGSAEVISRDRNLRQVKLCLPDGTCAVYDYDEKGLWTARGPHDLDIINVPEPPSLDLTKPVQTRGGCQVRILCTDAGIGSRKGGVVGILYEDDGHESVRTWLADGVHGREYGYGDTMDLVNVPAEQL